MGRHLKPTQTLLECQEILTDSKSGAMQGRWILFPDEESRDNWLEHAIGGTDCCPNCGGQHEEATEEEAKRLRDAAVVVPSVEDYDGMEAENGIPLVVFVLTGPMAATAAPAIEMTLNAIHAMFGGGGARPLDDDVDEEPSEITEGEIESLDLDELTRRLTGGDSQ